MCVCNYVKKELIFILLSGFFFFRSVVGIEFSFQYQEMTIYFFLYRSCI